ncbi:unnamed protein product [Symbiodinium natans]|uniref:Methyltransferase type 11 domain-containing protein n=1 Tax=Symbiodinium natans TaxID=878477 RepID=A0A812M6L0_9DINO|nr:unnamed protein product [Symbiodinium natans]
MQPKVVALDFSESMLRQVDDFAKKEIGPDYVLGLGGLWTCAWKGRPNPENAVAEVSRVLRPGGVFVLTTFMPRGPLRTSGARETPYKFWTEEELRSLWPQGLQKQSIKLVLACRACSCLTACLLWHSSLESRRFHRSF